MTRLGKLLRPSSLDELRQRLNVLKGGMSLVGPRPHALARDNEHRVQVAGYAFRRHVKPGMTGWARATASLEKMAERVKLDLRYINNWPRRFDINVLFRTCGEVLRDPAY